MYTLMVIIFTIILYELIIKRLCKWTFYKFIEWSFKVPKEGDW